MVIDTYRALIQRIHDRDGPLVWSEADVIDVARLGRIFHIDELNDEAVQDVLAGVLRRDMHDRDMSHVEHWSRTQSPSGAGPEKIVHNVLWATAGRDDNGGAWEASSVLEGFMRAWLDAYEKGGWGSRP